MKKGRNKACIDGYMYLEIAGQIQINRYLELPDGRYQVLAFQSIDANFEFSDETLAGVEKSISALIIASRVRKTADGFKTEFELEVY